MMLFSYDSCRPILIALICAWGKHRSRWLANCLGRWLEQLDDSVYTFEVMHLSDRNRMLEMRHANKQKRDGYSHSQAIQSAKHMGLRRKRAEFDNIKWDLYLEDESSRFRTALDRCYQVSAYARSPELVCAIAALSGSKAHAQRGT